MGQRKTAKEPDEGSASANHKQVPLKISENCTIIKRLDLAAVCVLKDTMDLKLGTSLVYDSDLEFVYLSSLSPSKLVIFFENEMCLLEATKETSSLRSLFADVRKWSIDECCNDRLTWVECRGLHPHCSDLDNFRLFGEKWGEVMHIDNVFHGLNSLTSARMLIQTKKQKIIDECVKIEWGNGSCVVWVHEIDSLDVKKPENFVNLDLGKKNRKSCELLEVENGIQEHDMENANQAMVKNNEKDGQHMENDEDLVVEGRSVDLTSVRTMQQIDQCNNNQIGDWSNLNAIRMKEVQDTMNDGNIQQQNDIFAVQNGLGTVIAYQETGIGHQNVLVGTESKMSSQGNVHQQPFMDPLVTESFARGTQEIQCESNNMTVMELRGVSSEQVERIDEANNENTSETDTGSNDSSPPKIKQRGRPRRVVSSLPEPLVVPETPQTSQNEVLDTWNTAKKVGVSARNEGAVLTALRKSRRIQMLERNIRSAGR